MFVHLRTVLIAVFIIAAPVITSAQGTSVAFGGLKIDTGQPVEMSADQLQINQANGNAVFSGNVVIGQGSMRLSASRVVVEYATSTDGSTTGAISKMHASGGVVLVNGAEAAESAEAIYTINSGNIVMTGNVVLTQGHNALSSQRMVVNLKTGQATLSGRVKTILQSGNN